MRHLRRSPSSAWASWELRAPFAFGQGAERFWGFDPLIVGEAALLARLVPVLSAIQLESEASTDLSRPRLEGLARADSTIGRAHSKAERGARWAPGSKLVADPAAARERGRSPARPRAPRQPAYPAFGCRTTGTSVA